MFSLATARLAPELVNKFDSETLAAKFIRVEKECDVKINGYKSTFSVTGEWTSIRKAHTLLKYLISESLDNVTDQKYKKARLRTMQKTGTGTKKDKPLKQELTNLKSK